jgi:hypothetical protein
MHLERVQASVIRASWAIGFALVPGGARACSEQRHTVTRRRRSSAEILLLRGEPHELSAIAVRLAQRLTSICL